MCQRADQTTFAPPTNDSIGGSHQFPRLLLFHQQVTGKQRLFSGPHRTGVLPVWGLSLHNVCSKPFHYLVTGFQNGLTSFPTVSVFLAPLCHDLLGFPLLGFGCAVFCKPPR